MGNCHGANGGKEKYETNFGVNNDKNGEEEGQIAENHGEEDRVDRTGIEKRGVPVIKQKKFRVEHT